MSELSFGEKTEFRDTVRRFFQARSAEPVVRKVMATTNGFDPDLWREMSEQLGLQAIAIPERFGGAGFSCVELGTVLGELGRALVCGPYFASVVLAANALILSCDEEAGKNYLPEIAAGSRTATVALSEDFSQWGVEGIRMPAVRRGKQWALSGAKVLVLDGTIADLVLVVCLSDSGLSLFAVEGTHPGLRRVPVDTLDPTRKFSRLEFNEVPARLVGAEGRAEPLVSQLLDIAGMALAVEAVGGCERCLEMAVDHAKTRIQFGKPIGSFQAIQHKCAELMVEVELAKSAACLAMHDAAESFEKLAISAPMAKAFCADVYCRVTAENIQIHGGMGFTWDHPAHLFYRRARSIQLMLGDGSYHREKLVQRLDM